jgi:hypothetical protein
VGEGVKFVRELDAGNLPVQFESETGEPAKALCAHVGRTPPRVAGRIFSPGFYTHGQHHLICKRAYLESRVSKRRPSPKPKEIIGKATKKPLHVQYAELKRLRQAVQEAAAQFANRRETTTAR